MSLSLSTSCLLVAVAVNCWLLTPESIQALTCMWHTVAWVTLTEQWGPYLPSWPAKLSLWMEKTGKQSLLWGEVLAPEDFTGLVAGCDCVAQSADQSSAGHSISSMPTDQAKHTSTIPHPRGSQASGALPLH